MNRILTLFCACILLAVLFSCGKKNNFSTAGTITATINGVSYTSASVTGMKGAGFYAFSSIDAGKTTSLILYIDSIAPGIYAYNNGTFNALQYNKGGLTYGTVTALKDSIVITSTGANTITGTFSGVLGINYVDSIVITNGVFTNCAY